MLPLDIADGIHLFLRRPGWLGTGHQAHEGGEAEDEAQPQDHDSDGQAFTRPMKISTPMATQATQIDMRINPAKVFSCARMSIEPCAWSAWWWSAMVQFPEVSVVPSPIAYSPRPVTGLPPLQLAEPSPESPPSQPAFSWNPMRRGGSALASFGTARKVTDSWVTCWISWVFAPSSSRP